MRAQKVIYHVNRDAGSGIVWLHRDEDVHVHDASCLSDLSTADCPVLKCGRLDAGEIARSFGRSTATDRQREMIHPTTAWRLRQHSPDGFEFGYAGSGPAQLALAILLDFTEDDELALRNYQDFKFRFVQHWRGEEAQVSGEQIADFLKLQAETDAAFNQVT